MKFAAQPTQFREIERMKDMYRQEANCQIIHDSILGRGLAEAYLFTIDGAPAGYGGVWNRYDPGMVMEFYTLPTHREHSQAMFREFVAVSGATRMEAQSNMALMSLMLFDFGQNIQARNILFGDSKATSLASNALFRSSCSVSDRARAGYDPDGDYVLEIDGEVIASGGFLCHYNPPYGDIYMSVAESERRKGYGSYLVQELKRVCYQAGRTPAARCNPDNPASRQTLQRAGFLSIGRLLVADLA